MIFFTGMKKLIFATADKVDDPLKGEESTDGQSLPMSTSIDVK